MKKVRGFFPLLIAIALLSASCEGPPGLFGSEEPELVGTVWRLERATPAAGPSMYRPEEEEVYAIRFKENGKVLAQSNCNGCGGSYTLYPPDSITVSVHCTESLCVPRSSFSQYGSTIAHTSGYTIEDNQLQLLTTDPPKWLPAADSLQTLHHEAAGCSDRISFCD